MATAYISLFPGGTATDGSGSGNNTAALSYEVSGGTPPTNSPKVTQLKLLFDGTTDEHWLFSLLLPGDYASGGTLRGEFKMTSATSGNVQMKASQVTTADAATDNNKVFETVTTTGAVAVPGTAGLMKEFTIALTTTGMAANEKCIIFIGRDSDDGNDTVTTDLELVVLNLEYTTT